MCTIVSRSGCRPAAVSLEMTMKTVVAGTHSESWTAGGREFHSSGAAAMKLWAPNEVRRNGMESSSNITGSYCNRMHPEC